MEVKLFDSELKVMEVLWREGELTAGSLAKILKEQNVLEDYLRGCVL